MQRPKSSRISLSLSPLQMPDPYHPSSSFLNSCHSPSPVTSHLCSQSSPSSIPFLPLLQIPFLFHSVQTSSFHTLSKHKWSSNSTEVCPCPQSLYLTTQSYEAAWNPLSLLMPKAHWILRELKWEIFFLKLYWTFVSIFWMVYILPKYKQYLFRQIVLYQKQKGLPIKERV